MKPLILTLLLTACGSTDVGANKGSDIGEKLQQKLDFYLSETKKLQDKKGWLDFGCDSVGFNSLYYLIEEGHAPNHALDSTGRLWRRWQKDCLAAGKSKATISADHVVMWLVFTQQKGDWRALNRFIDKMEDSNYKIGDHDGSTDGLSRVHLGWKNPQVTALLYDVKDYLGSHGHKIWSAVDQSWDPKYGYPGHILSWRAWIYSKIHGMPDAAKRALEKQLEWNPDNALYHAMLSRYVRSHPCPIGILLDENLFPSDRLPESKDRCSDYLWQRDLGPDYEPCDDGKVHSGLDFILPAAICMGTI